MRGRKNKAFFHGLHLSTFLGVAFMETHLSAGYFIYVESCIPPIPVSEVSVLVSSGIVLGEQKL